MTKEHEPRPARIHRAYATEGRLYFGFKATQLFSDKALEDIRQNPPNLGKATQRNWERDLAITTAYLRTDQTQQEVANQYGRTRQRIEQVVKDTIARLHTYSSPNTKLLFPDIEALTFQKPLSQRSRERKSAAGGGASLQVARMLKEGVSVREIMGATGSSTQRLASIRRRLAAWGQEVPYPTDRVAHHKEYQELAQKLKDETLPSEEVSRLLDQVNWSFHQYYAEDKDDPPIIAVRTLARQTGLHMKGGQAMQDLVSALRVFTIPVKSISREVQSGPQKGVKTYYVMAASSRTRAQEAFLEHPNLQKFKKHPVQK